MFGRVTLLALSALALLLSAPSARAADAFKPTPAGCFAFSDAACSALAVANGLWQVKLSPDKKFAYAAAWDSGVLHVFTRDPATSALTWARCYSEGAEPECTDVEGIAQPDDVEITPDGEFLYVSSWMGKIAAFDRDPATGELTQFLGTAACISHDGSGGVCEDARGTIGGTPGLGGMVMSPDGKHLYAAQVNGGAVLALRIESDGTLEQIANQGGCVNNEGGDGCFNGRALSFDVVQIAISPDGSQVYLPSAAFKGVVVLNRNTTSGALTQADGTTGCVSADGDSGDDTKPCAVDARVGSAADTVHVAGDNLYLAFNGGIVTFRREGGGLTPLGCVNDAGTGGCANGRNSADLAYANHTPDGQHLFVGTFDSRRMTIYARDGAGNLTSVPGPDGCLSKDGKALDEGVEQTDACTVTPAAGEGRPEFVDDNRFYSGNYEDTGAIGLFVRDFYPQCQNRSVDVAHNTAKAVDFACADRNGENVTLEIVSPPVSGSLGAIDQGADRVFYNPFAGFSGTDSFSYRGTAGALTSNTATVSLSVAASAVDADRDGVPLPADCDDNNAAVRPGAAEVPGNAVDEDCAGGPAPAPPGRIVSGIDYFFDATNRRFTRVTQLTVTNLIAGSLVTVTCKGKGCRFKSKKRTFAAATKKFDAKRYFNFKKGKRKIVSKLKAGTKIEIRITAVNMIGKVVTFTTRKGKRPALKVTCLPPGATKPQATC